jgi:hypothetical protein
VFLQATTPSQGSVAFVLPQVDFSEKIVGTYDNEDTSRDVYFRTGMSRSSGIIGKRVIAKEGYGMRKQRV